MDLFSILCGASGSFAPKPMCLWFPLALAVARTSVCSGSVHCSCQAFKILDRYDAPSCNSTVSLSWGIRVAYSIFCALNWRIFKVSLVFDIVIWFDVIFLEFLPRLVLIFYFASMCRVVRKHDRVSRTRAKTIAFFIN